MNSKKIEKEINRLQTNLSSATTILSDYEVDLPNNPTYNDLPNLVNLINIYNKGADFYLLISHCDENGIWHRPTDWDDIESMSLEETDGGDTVYLLIQIHDADPRLYLGIYLFNAPFTTTSKAYLTILAGRIYTPGIFTSLKQVFRDLYLNTGWNMQIDLSEYIGVLDYIVLKIHSTGYLARTWTASTTKYSPAVYLSSLPILMRYGKMTAGNNIALSSVYLESDYVIDLGKYWENTTTSFAIGAYSLCFNLLRVRLPGFHPERLKITSFANMFANTTMLTDVGENGVLDCTGWVTSSCTTIAGFFRTMRSFPGKLIVKNWDVSNVTSMVSVFNACHKVKEIEGLETWTAAPKCTSAETMFSYCFNLRTPINVSSLRLGQGTANFTSMSLTFTHCFKVPKIDISNWNLSKITTLYQTFCYTPCLLEIAMDGDFVPISNLCKRSDGTFIATGIKNIVFNGWDFSGITYNATYMMYLWFLDPGLESVKFINCQFPNTFMTSSTLGNYPFSSNPTIKELDISDYDDSNSVNRYMTLYCFRNLANLLEFYPPLNISWSINLLGAYLLSKESILRIINNLATPKNPNYAVITLDSNVYKLTDEEKAIATNKGWTLS